MQQPATICPTLPSTDGARRHALTRKTAQVEMVLFNLIPTTAAEAHG